MVRRYQHLQLSTELKEVDFIWPDLKEKYHDGEVVTNYVGELLQHDPSHHKWSPYCNSMWYLITTIDDYLIYMLYAKLVERETTWTHIEAIESVILKYGLPYSYYVDSHSIFKFVQGRGCSLHRL